METNLHPKHRNLDGIIRIWKRIPNIIGDQRVFLNENSIGKRQRHEKKRTVGYGKKRYGRITCVDKKQTEQDKWRREDGTKCKNVWKQKEEECQAYTFVI